MARLFVKKVGLDDQGDSVGQGVVLVQAWRPEFEPKNPCKDKKGE